MTRFSHKFILWLLVVTIFGLEGCGTIRTMPTLGSYDAPKIYSGTRLDVYAAADDESHLALFSVTPPEHPVIDMPFSFILDTIILPVIIPVVSYELVFGR